MNPRTVLELWLIFYFPGGIVATLVSIYMWGRLRKEGPYMILEILSWIAIAIHCLTTSTILLWVLVEANDQTSRLLQITFLLTVALFILSKITKGLYILGIGIPIVNKITNRLFGPFKSDTVVIPAANGD